MENSELFLDQNFLGIFSLDISHNVVQSSIQCLLTKVKGHLEFVK
jgi:hypothetical protein